MNRKLKITLVVLAALAATGLITLALLVNYGSMYFAPEELEQAPLPGDSLLLERDKQLKQTLVIIIDAPPEKVWPYLAQMGQKRAGFYSFEWLERLFGFDIRNTYVIRNEWQDIRPGQWMFYHQNGIGSEVKEVASGEYFTMLSDSRNQPSHDIAFALNPIPGGEFAWTWNFILQEAPGVKTRLIERCAAHFKPDNFCVRQLVKLFLGVPSIVMCTNQMEVLKALAEGKKVE